MVGIRPNRELKTPPMLRNVFAVLTGLLALASTAKAQSFTAPALPEIPGKIFNVTNYGALGDGVATNTAAIQAAIDAASSAEFGSVVQQIAEHLGEARRIAQHPPLLVR